MSLDEHLERQANEHSEFEHEEKRKPGTKIKPALKDKREKMASKMKKERTMERFKEDRIK